MTHVIVGALYDHRFAERYAAQMYQLRYKVFHSRLGWQVKTIENQEFDDFDDERSIYLLTTPDGNLVNGGWRLRATTYRYMLGDVFSELLDGGSIPKQPDIWEISRFAIDTTQQAGKTFGFRDASRKLVAETIRFAADNGITQFVMVVSVAIERLLCGLGLKLHRFSSPKRLGKILSVAVWLDIDAHTRHIALREQQPMLAAA